jgi:hypothetical protein
MSDCACAGLETGCNCNCLSQADLLPNNDVQHKP